MSDKPSLYVVEKKEVVILVVLFVLVTVLSFTMGVRYGESVGKKAAQDFTAAEREHGDAEEKAVGGTLGQAPAGHSSEPAGHAAEHKEHAAPAAHGEPVKHEEPTKSTSSPEVAAAPGAASNARANDSADKNADEFLLNALKEVGVEPPGGKTRDNAKLPSEPKKATSGSYVIQVGSHPTRAEAESQVRQLKNKNIQAEILTPFKDRQGEWHRVVLGSYKTKRDAEKEASALKGKGMILSFFVWRLP